MYTIHFQHNPLVPVGDHDYTEKMMTLLKGVVSTWYRFGLNLGIENEELQQIKNEPTAADCMSDLLDTWIKMKGSKATIFEIIRVCKNIGNIDLAERLQDDDDIKKQLKLDGGMNSVDVLS